MWFDTQIKWGLCGPGWICITFSQRQEWLAENEEIVLARHRFRKRRTASGAVCSLSQYLQRIFLLSVFIWGHWCFAACLIRSAEIWSSESTLDVYSKLDTCNVSCLAKVPLSSISLCRAAPNGKCLHISCYVLRWRMNGCHSLLHRWESYLMPEDCRWTDLKEGSGILGAGAGNNSWPSFCSPSSL